MILARRFPHALAGFVMLAVISNPAAGKDLASLSQLLTPAYTAMDYAAVCATDRSWTVSQPAGPRGSAIHYAQHIKDEIVAFLSYNEALTVLKAAADAARQDTYAQLRNHVHARERAEEPARLRAWCYGHANHLIEALIRLHDENHSAFMKRVMLGVSGDEAPAHRP
jgi:hypothetical protein